MAKLSSLKNNVAAEVAGVWVPYAAGIEVKIARLGNPKYEAYLRKLSAPHTRQLRDGELDNTVAEELTKRAMARHILLDWRGMEDDDGNEMVYSEQLAFEVLSNPEYRDFYRDIMEMANKRATFKEQEHVEAAKN